MKALVIVDMQCDFMPGGVLAVPGANLLSPMINRLIPLFPVVVATQDWHPADHISFAGNHPGKQVGDVIYAPHGLQQILWPVHCVQGSEGAALVKELNTEQIAGYFFKGTDPAIDSYSAFFDNAHLKSTGLSEDLKARGVDEVVLVGVAIDYCVLYSVLDALKLGFKATVVLDACRGINLHPGDVDAALELMQESGARVIASSELVL